MRMIITQVLNALHVDPGRTWKGVWRWFDESKLDCCKPLERSACILIHVHINMYLWHT